MLQYNITAFLVEWLESQVISPWVQFKALQVLKIRRYQGEIELTKMGIKINLDIS